MAEFDPQTGRLDLKIVYYGPGRSGKTTNLMRLHDLSSETHRGQMISLTDDDDTTLFFDLLPMAVRDPSGLDIRFKLYTVPGQVQHNATRKAVLVRTDGIVFVADSRNGESTNNFASFTNLESNLKALGTNMTNMPLALQYNKRDLPNIVGEDEVRATWEKAGIPVNFSCALEGRGVIETFSSLLPRVLARANERFDLAARGFEASRFWLTLIERFQRNRSTTHAG